MMDTSPDQTVVSASAAAARPGVARWRVVTGGSHLQTVFRTGSMSTGVALLDRIVDAAEALNHHPDLDLRYPTLHVSLTTHSTGTLTEADLLLAEQISDIAEEMGIEADPSAVVAVEIGIDAIDVATVLPFWQAVLGYDSASDGAALADPAARGPNVWFQQMDKARPERNRVHVDVYVPHDEAAARVEAALGAGGRLLDGDHAPSFWVMADPEGNEACICTWQERGAR